MKALLLFLCTIFSVTFSEPPCDSAHLQLPSCKTNLAPFMYMIPTYDFIKLYRTYERNNETDAINAFSYLKSQKFKESIEIILNLNSMTPFRQDAAIYKVTLEELLDELLGRLGYEIWEENSNWNDIIDSNKLYQLLNDVKNYVDYEKIKEDTSSTVNSMSKKLNEMIENTKKYLEYDDIKNVASEKLYTFSENLKQYIEYDTLKDKISSNLEGYVESAKQYVNNEEIKNMASSKINDISDSLQQWYAGAKHFIYSNEEDLKVIDNQLHEEIKKTVASKNFHNFLVQAKSFVRKNDIDDKSISSFYQSGIYKKWYCHYNDLDKNEFKQEATSFAEIQEMLEELNSLNIDLLEALQFVKSLFINFDDFECY